MNCISDRKVNKSFNEFHGWLDENSKLTVEYI